MPTLFQWNLILRQGLPVAVGIVSKHPGIPERIRIHTSPILQAEKTGDGFELKTISGNIYHVKAGELKGEECGGSAGKKEALSPELPGLPPDFRAQCARARKEALDAEKEGLRPLMKPGTLFMQIVGTHILSAFWADPNARIRDIFIGLCPGMFQDAYLLRSAYEEASTPRQIECCLFPAWKSLELDPISRGIQSVLIRNDGCTDIKFGFPRRTILCAAGTTVPYDFTPCSAGEKPHIH